MSDEEREIEAEEWLKENTPSNATLREWAAKCVPPIESLDEQEERPW